MESETQPGGSVVLEAQKATSGVPIALFILSWVAFGAIDTFAPREAERVLSIAHMLIMSFLIFWWVEQDRRSHGGSVSGGMALSVLIFGILSVPVYLAMYRDRAELVRAALKGLLILGISIAAYAGVHLSIVKLAPQF